MAGTARPELEPVPDITGHQAMVSGWLPTQVHLPTNYVSLSVSTQVPKDRM